MLSRVLPRHHPRPGHRTQRREYRAQHPPRTLFTQPGQVRQQSLPDQRLQNVPRRPIQPQNHDLHRDDFLSGVRLPSVLYLTKTARQTPTLIPGELLKSHHISHSALHSCRIEIAILLSSYPNTPWSASYPTFSNSHDSLVWRRNDREEGRTRRAGQTYHQLAKVIPSGAGLYGERSKDAARASAAEDGPRTISDREFATAFPTMRSGYRGDETPREIDPVAPES